MHFHSYRRSMCAVSLCSLLATAGAVGQDSEVPPPKLDQPRAGVTIRATEQADVTCYAITTTGDVNAPEQKFWASWKRSSVVAFRFRAPWRGTRYLKSIRPLIDHRNLLEQGKLLRSLVGGTPGTVSSFGVHPNSELLFSWGRSGSALELDAAEGIAVPADALLELEHHYTSLDDAEPLDGSGVEVCVSPEVPKRLVAVTLLGVPSDFEGTKVTGVCKPKLSASIDWRPLAAYTRRRGQSVTLDRTRSNGETEAVFAWTAAAPQPVRADPTWLTLDPGDKLSVTCTYDGPVKGALEGYYEACEMLVLHTPPGALATRSIASIVNGLYTCM